MPPTPHNHLHPAPDHPQIQHQQAKRRTLQILIHILILARRATAPCPLPLEPALDVQLSGVNSQQQFTFTDWTRAPFSARVSFDALPLSV